jgi:uncharacterized protein (TIGR02118 family)
MIRWPQEDAVYKVVAAWSAPKPEDVPAFEKHYLDIHAPLASAVPELRRIVLTRTTAGLEGAAPAFHRIAEMCFDSEEALARSSHSQEWKSLREDAGVMIGKFNVKLDVGMGWEKATSGGGGFDLDGVDRLLSTTRAVRKRLDLTRAVPKETLLECIALSQQAPTGSNRQGWRWMVVTDPSKRKRLAEIYKAGGGEYLAQARAATPSGDQQTARVYDSALWLVDHLHEVPVHVIPCIQGRIPPETPDGMKAGFFGSIYPAVWSFQLALRSRGLGSVLTTLHLNKESDAAELLGIPKDVTQVGLLPVAYTKGMDFKPATRPAPETITHFDRWA